MKEDNNMSRKSNGIKREVIANGMIRLSSVKGIRDVRNDRLYSVVECEARNEKFYVEGE